MLSSIWVATTTGLPAARDLRVISFCNSGTRSTGISTPRSPRATISASDAAITSSRSVIAEGFSILLMMAAAVPMIFRAARTSSPRCTKLSATQSTPSRSAKSRSTLSFSVSASIGSSVSGIDTPLRLARLPATRTLASMMPCFLPITCMRILPSSSSSTWPGSMASKICGCGRKARVAEPSLSVWSKRKVDPAVRSTLPPAMSPTRNFGPCKSQRIPIGRPNLASVARIAACSFFGPSCGGREWLMLMRNTSTPASNSLPIISSDADAGPKVATIFTRRLRRMMRPRRARGSVVRRDTSCAQGRIEPGKLATSSSRRRPDRSA